MPPIVDHETGPDCVMCVHFLSLSLFRDKSFSRRRGLKEHPESAVSDGVVSIRGVRVTGID